MFRKSLNGKPQFIQPFFYPTLFLVMLSTFAGFGIPAVHGYEWTDDFSSYAEGSLGNPRWSAGSVDWTMAHGAYQLGGLTDSFSVADGHLNCRDMEIEATVTVLDPTQRDTWRVAGVAIYNNPRDFWHFALVESPSDQNKRHFLELSEKRENVWLAQENLTVTASEHMDFDWQY
ncbi:hypothetical protein JW824_13465, partial [bacterium]|nr:hypothetical protein [bacterium]